MLEQEISLLEDKLKQQERLVKDQLISPNELLSVRQEILRAKQKLAEFKPASFGLTNNLVAPSQNYGKRSVVYDGVEVTFSARFGQGGLLQG